MKHLYFAYGSNTHLKQMEQRCPGAVNLGPAYLQDYRLVFRIHADIELCEHSTVAGVLWEIDDNHLASLDRYEGFPAYYLRHRVFVKTTADEPKSKVLVELKNVVLPPKLKVQVEAYKHCEGFAAVNVPSRILSPVLWVIPRVKVSVSLVASP